MGQCVGSPPPHGVELNFSEYSVVKSAPIGVTMNRQATRTLSLTQTENIPNIKVRHQKLGWRKVMDLNLGNCPPPPTRLLRLSRPRTPPRPLLFYYYYLHSYKKYKHWKTINTTIQTLTKCRKRTKCKKKKNEKTTRTILTYTFRYSLASLLSSFTYLVINVISPSGRTTLLPSTEVFLTVLTAAKNRRYCPTLLAMDRKRHWCPRPCSVRPRRRWLVPAPGARRLDRNTVADRCRHRGGTNRNVECLGGIRSVVPRRLREWQNTERVSI